MTQHHQSSTTLELSKQQQQLQKHSKAQDRVRSVDGKTQGVKPQGNQVKRKEVRPLSSNMQSKANRGSDKNQQRISQITNQNNLVNVDESSPIKDVSSLDKKLISHLQPL